MIWRRCHIKDDTVVPFRSDVVLPWDVCCVITDLQTFFLFRLA